MVYIFVLEAFSNLLSGLRFHREHVFFYLFFFCNYSVAEFQHLVHRHRRQRDRHLTVGLIIFDLFETFIVFDYFDEFLSYLLVERDHLNFVEHSVHFNVVEKPTISLSNNNFVTMKHGSVFVR